MRDLQKERQEKAADIQGRSRISSQARGSHTDARHTRPCCSMGIAPHPNREGQGEVVMPMRPPVHRMSFQKPPEQARLERQRAHDAKRPPSSRRGYDKDWSRLRALFIEANPICSMIGCGFPTVDVHHKVDVRIDPSLRLVWDNLLSLCHSCHSRVTRRRARERVVSNSSRGGGHF